MTEKPPLALRVAGAVINLIGSGLCIALSLLLVHFAHVDAALTLGTSFAVYATIRGWVNP